MKATIFVKLKKQVLDTAGKAVENSIDHSLGFKGVKNVRIGKLIELDIDENDTKKADEIVHKICDELLVNQVIEDYSFELK